MLFNCRARLEDDHFMGLGEVCVLRGLFACWDCYLKGDSKTTSVHWRRLYSKCSSRAVLHFVRAFFGPLGSFGLVKHEIALYGFQAITKFHLKTGEKINNYHWICSLLS